MKAKHVSRKSHMYKFLDKWGNEFYEWQEYTICEFYFKFITAIFWCAFVFIMVGLLGSSLIAMVVDYFYSLFMLVFHTTEFIQAFKHDPDNFDSFSIQMFVMLNGLLACLGFIKFFSWIFNREQKGVCSIRDIMRKRCKTMVEFTD